MELCMGEEEGAVYLMRNFLSNKKAVKLFIISFYFFLLDSFSC